MTLSTGLSRRAVLQGAGALLVSAITPASAIAMAEIGVPVALRTPLPGELDSWIAVLADGSVNAFFGKMDMGHGLEIAIAQIVAEELDVNVERVQVLMGDTATTCNQGGASGSTGISQGARPLRNAAAEARRILLSSAAQRLDVTIDRLEVIDGVVRAIDNASKQTTYAELIGGKHFNAPLEWNQRVGNAMDVRVPARLKAPAQYRVVGQSIARRDVAGKVTGATQFITDVRVPGLLHARLIRPPRVAATIGAVDESSVASIPGVRVIREREVLAVVAPDEWNAVRAAQKLKVTWTFAADAPLPGSPGIHEHIRRAPALKREEPVRSGDVDAAFVSATRSITAEYEWPMQSHACMGPACAVADVRNDRATIWTGSQKPHFTRDGVAKLLNLPVDAVHGIWVPGPGSYGRNDAGDAALDAAYLSKLTGSPVRVQGMRADGTAWDPKSPAIVLRGRAAIDQAGNISAYEFTAKGLARANIAANESDPSHSLVGMALGMPLKPDLGLGVPADSYTFAAKLYAWEAIAPLVERYSPLRTSHLRDPVGPDIHFGSEQFIDEIAHSLGEDPVAFRLRHVAQARDAAAIKAVAEQAQWQPRGTRLKQKRGAVLKGRGIAYAQRSETVVAVIADIEVTPASGRLWVRKVTVAHDCGLIVNPGGLRLTIEGNVVQGLSRTLFEEVRFDRQSVTSVDWTSYPILEMQDAPEAIDIVLIDRPELPSSGAGEPTIRCIPAAVANAFYDATGVRARRAPLTPERVKSLLVSADAAQA